MKTTLIIYLLLLLISSSISGCIETSEPYSPIKYSITIETNDQTTVYLPVLLDLPNNTVADLVDSLKVEMKESPDIEVSYDIIDTIHGKALRINTSGNVSLKAVSSFKYYDSHPEMPITPFISKYEDEPKFFDISMKTNETNPYVSFHNAYLENSNNHQIKVKIVYEASTEVGGEYCTSLPDGTDERHYFFTMEPGWQVIGFEREVGYF